MKHLGGLARGRSASTTEQVWLDPGVKWEIRPKHTLSWPHIGVRLVRRERIENWRARESWRSVE